MNWFLTSLFLLQKRVELEKNRIEHLPVHFKPQKMEKDIDLTNERECFSCFYDLHMSAACCKCSPDRFACLKHASILCSCEKDDRFVLVRYTMDELSTLIEALEEELGAVEAWTSLEKGLVCINCEDNVSGISCPKQNDGPDFFPKTEETLQEETANRCMSQVVTNGHKKNIVGKSTDTMPPNRCFIDLNLDSMSIAQESLLKQTSDIYNANTMVNEDNVCNNVLVREGFHRELDSRQLGSCSGSSVSYVISDNVHPSPSMDVSDRCASNDNLNFGCLSTNEVVDQLGIKDSQSVKRGPVQKFSFDVHPINIGYAVYGRLWCNKQVIYPKGMYLYM